MDYNANDIFDYAIDILQHYGTKYHSGRYPWGSGDNPHQHDEGYPFKTSGDFLSRVEELEKKGLTEKQIAEKLSEDAGGTITVKQLRVYKSVAKNERKAAVIRQVKELHDSGMNNSEIGRKLGLGESTVRNYLKANTDAKRQEIQGTVDFLKSQVDEKGMVAIGPGDELYLGVSQTQIDNAIIQLQAEGYEVYKRRVEQAANPDQYTTIRVACKPGTEYKDVYKNDEIQFLFDYTSHDEGKTFTKMQYPASLDSSRIQVKYAEEGGIKKDGVIEIRRGCKDLDLGDGCHYAQVRILVDGTHYIKGMAVYSDDLPEGCDVRFNTNKKEGTPMLGEDKDNTVFKPIKSDPENPFGAYISPKGQSMYVGDDGEEHLSLINKRQNEGDWDSWSNELPSQFLAKQRPEMIQKQLDLSIADKQVEYEEIMSITNPTIKKQLLLDFAGDCDATAVELSAAALPRQKYNVLLPLESIGDNEVYAPNFKDGETVALIRFPHGGTFEIPILTVNNNNKEGKEVITPGAADAVGINKHVADRLSGADFDGDTVLVIPTTKGRNGIESKNTLKGLEGFDPKVEYPPLFDPDNPTKQLSKRLSDENTQKQMGIVSNLIMDMTIKGASDEELARAVRHSMVIIDANKHNLNYEASYKENGIGELISKYKTIVDEDGNESHGASTLITRAGSEVNVAKRKGSPRINPEDGTVYYNVAPDSERFYTDEKGNKKERYSKSTQMAETKNPYELSSGTFKEELYASYASKLKTMANTSRLTYLETPNLKYDKEAATKYAAEVASLKAKLNESEKNAPRERAANIRAEAEVKNRIAILKKDRPDISKKELRKERKKIAQTAIDSWRAEFNAHRIPINISDKEWEAIQAGALHQTTFERILKYADKTQLRQRATPHPKKELSPAQINRIKAMANSGYTNEQIAQACNCSRSAVIQYKKA